MQECYFTYIKFNSCRISGCTDMSPDLQHKPGLVTDSGPRLRVPAIFPRAKLSKVVWRRTEPPSKPTLTQKVEVNNNKMKQVQLHSSG